MLKSGGLAIGALAAWLCGCSKDEASGHSVYFVGYIYDGASGKRLGPQDIAGISIKYRDQTIHTHVEDDGRFVTTEPLPTWQDYTVYVGAAGYRPFVSNNPGFDVPKSLAMTEGATSRATIQTFHFDAYLFPLDLQTPKVTISIEKSDATITVPPPERAQGTIRLRPQSASSIEQDRPMVDARWTNDEDLLNQTITKSFTGGTIEIAAGELVYGVTYGVAVYDVEGYQPLVGSTSPFFSTIALVAGATTSLSVTVQVNAKAPLRVLGTNADSCIPPSPTVDAYGATIDITFSEEVEAGGPTFAEDVDAGVSFTTASSSTSYYYCPLNVSTDASKQERGTRATFNGNVLTLSFNPVVGLTTITPSGIACTTPPAFTAIIYGGLSNIYVRPKGDPVRRQSLSTMISALTPFMPGVSSSGISCPPRAPQF